MVGFGRPEQERRVAHRHLVCLYQSNKLPISIRLYSLYHVIISLPADWKNRRRTDALSSWLRDSSHKLWIIWTPVHCWLGPQPQFEGTVAPGAAANVVALILEAITSWMTEYIDSNTIQFSVLTPDPPSRNFN